MTVSVVDGGGSLDYQRVALLCERVGTLPPLPGAALELIRVLDQGEDSIAALEHVVSRDLGLTAEVLKVASDHLPDEDERLSLRNAIAILGFNSVRSVALSMALHTTIAEHAEFRNLKQKGSICGLFVGQAARFMFARTSPQERMEAGLSIDEVYSMGILCNLSINLLAKLAPELLPQTIDYARTTGSTLHAAFFNLHGRRLEELGALATYTWGLPEIFVSCQEYLARPATTSREALAWSCVWLARELAELHGVGLCDWTVLSDVPQEAMQSVSISSQEIEDMVEVLKKRLELETQAKPAKHAIRERHHEQKAPHIASEFEGLEVRAEQVGRIDRLPARPRLDACEGDGHDPLSSSSRVEETKGVDAAEEIGSAPLIEIAEGANGVAPGNAPSRIDAWKKAILGKRRNRAACADETGTQSLASQAEPVRPTRLFARGRHHTGETQPAHRDNVPEWMESPKTISGRVGALPGRAPKPVERRQVRERPNSSRDLIELIRQKSDPSASKTGKDTSRYKNGGASGTSVSASQGPSEDYGVLRRLKLGFMKLLEW